MKFAVTAVSINRYTRQQNAEPRVELIDTERNELFKDESTALDVERRYESFWNDLNPNSKEIVKVISVETEPKELTVADIAARAIDEIREAGERDAFLNSSKGVEAAQREFAGLFEDVQRACAASSGLIVKPERKNKNTLVSMEAGGGVPRRVTFVFQLAVNNSLNGSALRLVEFDGTSAPRGSNQNTDFHFDFGPSGEYGWREGIEQGTGDFFTTPRLVNDVAKRLIEAIRDTRTNRQRTPGVAW